MHVEDLKILKAKVDGLYPYSLENEEYLLDVPFTVEEVAVAVCRLKSRKAAGPDGLMAEHLKFAGESTIIWLTNIIIIIIHVIHTTEQGVQIKY